MIEVLRCDACKRLAISVDDTRLTTESRKEKGHGSGKCAGQWTVVVAAEMPVSSKAAEAPGGQATAREIAVVLADLFAGKLIPCVVNGEDGKAAFMSADSKLAYATQIIEKYRS